MKMRRFTDAGIAAVRELLPQIKTVDDLARAEALATNDDLAKPIDELASLDLDEKRVFPTTFAFCEYFHSLIKDHKPLTYRTDVGFWTWLAMVYVRQLVREDSAGGVDVKEQGRLVFDSVFRQSHRHLLSSPYYVYHFYADDPNVCKAVLWNKLPVRGDLQEYILSRQVIVQTPALMQTVTSLYFDDDTQEIKPGAGSKGPGTPRRYVVAVDQFGLTKDFYHKNDADEFMRILPAEFDVFNPLKKALQ